MWYTAPAQLLKAEPSQDNSRINIKILASDETLDDENDNVYAHAFTEEVRKKFLEIGVVDYDHTIIRGANELEKASAIIGTPTAFYQELDKGAPVQFIEGYLHVGNPFVDNLIQPALRAKSDRLASSIGGRILGFNPNEHGGKGVHKITMNHIAITPKYKAVNKTTWIQELVKSGKMVEFDTVHALCKSLEAGSVTDMANVVGGQAIQPQSLEGKKVAIDFFKESVKYPFSKAIGKHIIMDLIEEEIGDDYDSIYGRSMVYGLDKKQAHSLTRMIMFNLAKSVAKVKRALAQQRGQSLLKIG